MIEFEKQKTFLKCSNKGRDPPNWTGFLDFETIAPKNLLDINLNVCPKHALEKLPSCKCSMSINGDSLKSLSYSLIIIDSNTEELLFDIFYIPINFYP